MDAAVIKFKASGQQLSVVSTNLFASNTVSYIRAEFELGYNWDGFDSVRAVWATDFAKIATVLDSEGACVVPWEVLKRTGTLYVNLVGSISDGDELTDRLTTYKAKALDVNGCTNVDGDNTQPITPSQFDQFVAIVHDDAEAAADARDEAKGYADDAEGYRDEAVGAAADAKNYRDTAKGYADDAEGYKDQAKGYAEQAEEDAQEIRNMSATATTLPEGSSATASYSDGVLSLGIPKGDTGATGATGNGIASAVLNADYTLTLNFTNGTHYTTPSIRGAQGIQGETGNGIDRIELTDTTGAVKTYTIYFTDGSTYDFEVTDGEVTLAELASVLPTDTASGAIASFPDGSDLFDYLSCVVNIDPVQDLHGYDKPWVGGAGVNKINVSSGSVTTTGSIGNVELPAGTYTASVYGYRNDGGSWRIYISSGDATIATSSNESGSTYKRVEVSFTLTETATVFLTLQFLSSYDTLNYERAQIEVGSTATSWTPWENLCPITGFTGCEADVIGFNQWDEEWELGALSTTGGNATSSTEIRSKNYIPVVGGQTYYLYCAVASTFNYKFYDADKNFISGAYIGRNNTLLIPNDARYMRFFMGAAYGTTYKNDICINLSDASLNGTYKPYNPNSAVYPVSWQTEAGTVYGGTVDVVSGVLTVDRASVDLGAVDYAMYNSGFSRARFRTTALEQLIKKPPNNNTPVEAFSSIFDLVNWGTGNSTNVVGVFGVDTDGDLSVWLNASDYSDATAFKTAMSGQTVVYELATPTTTQLTAQQVDCLLGQNNVWADCGSIEEVKYKADVQLWVEKMLNA